MKIIQLAVGGGTGSLDDGLNPFIVALGDDGSVWIRYLSDRDRDHWDELPAPGQAKKPRGT